MTPEKMAAEAIRELLAQARTEALEEAAKFVEAAKAEIESYQKVAAASAKLHQDHLNEIARLRASGDKKEKDCTYWREQSERLRAALEELLGATGWHQFQAAKLHARATLTGRGE